MVLSSPGGEWALTHLSKRASMLWEADSFQEIPMPHWRACSPVCKGSSDGILKHAASSPYVFMCVWHSPPLCRFYQFPPCFCWIHNPVLFPEHSTLQCSVSMYYLLASFRSYFSQYIYLISTQKARTIVLFVQKPRFREKWLLPMDRTMPMPWYWTSRQVFDATASLNQRAEVLGFSHLCKASELKPEGLTSWFARKEFHREKNSTPAGSGASELLIGT